VLGAVDDEDGPGEHVAGADRGGGRGEGHGDAEVGDAGGALVLGGELDAGQGVVGARGGERGGAVERVVVGADAELGRAVVALDGGGGSAEAGAEGRGEVDGCGPDHGDLWAAGGGDEDGGDDVDGEGFVGRGGAFERGAGEAVEQREVVFGEAVHGE